MPPADEAPVKQSDLPNSGEQPELLASSADGGIDLPCSGEQPDPAEAAETPAAAVNGEVDGSNEEPAEGASSLSTEDLLAQAEELFKKGSNAIEDGDFVKAVDCLSRALEIRVAHYGELAPDCSLSYYKYGCALLCKAQEETDPLGNVPKDTPGSYGKEPTISTVSSASSKTSTTIFEQPSPASESNGVLGGSCDNLQRDDEDSDSDQSSEEEDEEETDIDLAWKLLDIARVIVEKVPEDTMEKAKIFSALGEVSMEREDFETSLNDYHKALSIVEHLVEPDNRFTVDLNFRICMVLEVASKVEKAIPYCQRAISCCNSRLQRLKGTYASLKDTTGDTSKNSSNSGEPALSANLLSLEEEMELFSDFLSELEKKLEDLQQAVSQSSLSAEVLKAANIKSPLESKMEGSSTYQSSSQMAGISCGFDSPAVSTAATSNKVTDLGVVGRGIKRAVVSPLSAEPSPKKPMAENSAEKVDSSTASTV